MTNHFLTVVLYTVLAGLMLPAGGAIARIERLQPKWLEQELRHGVLAFGGGVLLAAVALVLVPEGARNLDPVTASLSFIAGGSVFLLVDRALTLAQAPASNLMAALLDFVPESMALGALVMTEPSLGALLALFVGLQNFPEGFNAYREMVVRGHVKPRDAIAALAAAVALGPVAGVTGLLALTNLPKATSIAMIFAAGGILYLVFQDIAPQARLARHWGPPLWAVVGFALALAATMLLRY